jgi:hypothetical protein|tara:strand:- start:411 stop:542 length:132 start_codon:yes stop_codon:yes gene_type:complete
VAFEILQNILSNPEWLKSIVIKSYGNKNSFEQQLANDIAYLLE